MTIAIIGSGAIGKALATQFARSKIEVLIANSRGPESLAALAGELGPHVKPASTGDALRADIVFLAVPFGAVSEAVGGAHAWDGRIVVDATNAIVFPAFKPMDLGGRPSTEIVAQTVPGARVVKAFNTVPAARLASDPATHGGRRVIFLSGSDARAKEEIADLIQRLGFQPIDLGTVAEGGRLQQFGGPLVAVDLIKAA